MAGTKMSDAAKAALTIEHGGQEYILSPLEIEDLAAAQRWAEEKPYFEMKRRMDILGDQCSLEMKTKMLDAAEAKAALVSDTSDGMGTVLASVEGVVYLLYLSLRRKHPELTVKDAGEMVDIATLGEWQQRLDRVSGFTDADDEEEKGTPGADPTAQTTGTSTE